MNNNKKFWILFFTFILMISLMACGDKNGDDPETNGSDIDPGVDSEQNEKTIVTDDLGLVTVEISEDIILNFHQDVWKEYAEDIPVPAGTFPVKAAGKVVDLIVAQVDALSFSNNLSDFIVPSLFLLREDGKVEWYGLDPSYLAEGDTIEDALELPFLEDIVSFSFEQEKEGIGDMTIFAQDAKGLNYDLRLPHRFLDFFDGVWSDMIYDGQDEYHVSLMFGKNGVAKLLKSKGYGDDWSANYTGEFTLHLDEEASKGRRPGVLTLKLYLDAGQKVQDIVGASEEIEGSFFLDSGALGAFMSFFHSDGDSLHEIQGQPVEEFEFWISYDAGIPYKDIHFLSTDFFLNEELISYLMDNVPEAEDLVKNKGMSVLVTGEKSFVRFDGNCRDIWLGTDHQENFVKEINYTVGAWGTIYEYDALSDSWDMVYDPLY